MRKVLVCLVFLLGACDVETIPPPSRPIPPPPPPGTTEAEGLPMTEAEKSDFKTLANDFMAQACAKKGTPEGDAELRQSGLFHFCASDLTRHCAAPTPGGDPWNAWYYDRPGFREFQVFDGIVCRIFSCDRFQPEIGFQASGSGDRRDIGLIGGTLWTRTGYGAVGRLHEKVCWDGAEFWIWPGFDGSWPMPTGTWRSIACYPWG